MINVFLLLGSNLGNRQFYLTEAIKAIKKNIAIVVKSSAVYETQSWGRDGQPDYLNQVVEVITSKSAQEILKLILEIEQSLGRERAEKWGSRTIDIDILLYGDNIINNTNLIIPHPEIQNRGFTLAPLAEIAPELMHPILKKSILKLKNELKNTLIIKKL